MRRLFYFFLPILLLLGIASMHAQERSKRLILKDGSYQIATKWEIHGDRVHYYSAERYDWEDIPYKLVDWDATNKFNQQNPRGANVNVSPDEVKEVDAEEKAEREKEEAARPLVAPGLRLPDSGGVFLFDTYRGQPQLVEIPQNGGELNKQTGKNIMRSVIIPIPTGAKQSIELKGNHANAQAHEATPTLFVDATPSSSDTQNNTTTSELTPVDRFKIVRVQVKKNTRVVSKVNVSLFGKVSNQEDLIPTTAEPVNGGAWMKITPQQSLAPGEYAVVEMLDPKTINMFVWDFGVNPSAPANASAWVPQATKEKPAASETNPSLSTRPK